MNKKYNYSDKNKFEAINCIIKDLQQTDSQKVELFDLIVDVLNNKKDISKYLNSIKNKKQRSDEQIRIANFFEGLNYAISSYDFELGFKDKSPKFIKHDGYTYSINLGGTVLELRCFVKDK